MKVLVIGHTYMLEINRNKFYELAKYPDVEIFLVNPVRWKTDFYTMNSELPRSDGMNVIALNCMFAGHESYYFYGSGLLNLIKNIKPDIIHVEQGSDAFSYFETIFLSKLFSRKSKRLFFTWVNWDAKIRFPLTFFERYNLRNTDYAICGNSGAAKILAKKGFKGGVKVLPQIGVDTELFKKNDVGSLKKSLGIDCFCIGYLGRFVREKGIFLLLEACSKIKGKLKILMVGDGPLKKEIIEEEAKRLDILSSLIIVPPQFNENVVPYINCMDVLVLPSYETETWKEQFGHVLIEAMACEVPVICSSSTEIPNVIGNAGLIFEEKNTVDLKDKIEMVMNDAVLAKSIAKNGLMRVSENYTHEMIAKKTLQIYKELLS